MSSNHSKSYEERMKAGKQFYHFLFRLFLTAAIVCCAGLGYLWFWLARYEARSPQGAIRTYLRQAVSGEYARLYEEADTYFLELNSEEAMTQKLEELFSGRDVDSLTDSLYYTSGKSRFYLIKDGSSYLCVLETTQDASDSEWRTRLAPETMYAFETMNGEDFSVRGIDIPDNFSSDVREAPRGFIDLGLNDDLTDVTRYEISGLIEAPEVTCASADDMAVLDELSQTIYIGPAPTDEQYQEFSAEIEDTAFAYCAYITEDGTFYALNQHLYPDTEFYNNISGFDNQWFSTHTSTSYENVRIYDVMPLGDTAFIGSISFDYVVTATSTTRTYSSVYQLYFVQNSRGAWKLTNLVILSGTES